MSAPRRRPALAADSLTRRALGAEHAGLRLKHALTVIDSHTAGQPTRAILHGLPEISGSSAVERRDALRRHHDWVRTTATLEPRGHRSIMSVALFAPSALNERWSLVFMDAEDYPDMCAHATIGVATTLVRLGLLAPPRASFSGSLPAVLDTPAGEVEIVVRLEQGHPRSVAIRLPLAFVLGDLALPTPRGPTTAHLAYAGQWYAFVEAAAFGLAVVPEQVDALIAHAPQVRAGLAQELRIEDPRTGEVPTVGNVVWLGVPAPGADGRHMPISAAGAFDRSPCGTATCARLALLHANGALRENASFVGEGVLGTRYTARVVRELERDGARGVLAELEGSAHLTGHAELGIDREDPLAGGFAIGCGPAIGCEPAIRSVQARR